MDKSEITDRLVRLRDALDYSTAQMAEAMGVAGQSMRDIFRGAMPRADKVAQLAVTNPTVNLHWLLTGNGEMFIEESTGNTLESNESRTNPLTDEEGYKKLELQIAQIRRELISAQAEIAGNRKYIDQLDAYRESQLRNAKQDVMDVESGLEALNEKISQRNNRAEQGI